jgi:primosomal protein N''
VMETAKLYHQLQANLKLIYHHAIDADAKLDALSARGEGRFKTIFVDDGLFSNHANRFLPYVEEAALNLEQLKTLPGELEAHLPRLVEQIERLHKTLASFEKID